MVWPAAIFLNEVKKDISEKFLRVDKYIFENIPVVHSPSRRSTPQGGTPGPITLCREGLVWSAVY